MGIFNAIKKILGIKNKDSTQKEEEKSYIKQTKLADNYASISEDVQREMYEKDPNYWKNIADKKPKPFNKDGNDKDDKGFFAL